MKNLWTVVMVAVAFSLGVFGSGPTQAQSIDPSAVPVPAPAKKREIGREKAAERKAANEKKAADRKAAEITAAADAPVKANGGVFKCVDRDGNITYGNVGDVKGCKRIETDAVNSVPFPRPATAARASQAKSDSSAQRARDTDRRRILQEELASEEKKLADIKKEYNGGEPDRRGDEKNFAKYQERSERLKADMSRSESNVETLRRELSAIRD